MDRAHVQRLLDNAVRPATVTVDLPVMGASLTLQAPNRDEVNRIMAASQGDDDWQAKALTGVLRMAALDDQGEKLLRSFAEAAAFLSALDDADAGVLLPTLLDLLSTKMADTAPDLEAGKAY